MPQIERMLVLSTAHIPKKLAVAFESTGVYRKPPIGVLFDNINGGYLIWVPGADADNDAPPEMQTLYQYARLHNCQWLKLDCDGEIIVELPKWNWE